MNKRSINVDKFADDAATTDLVNVKKTKLWVFLI